MKLGSPYFLSLLWMVPALFVFYIWAFRRKRVLIDKFVSTELRDRLLTGISVARQKLKASLIVLGCLFTTFALLQPKWGFHWEEVKRKGVDIILALDVSKSMLAEDVSPNRLERAKRKIVDFLRIVQGDRIGLIAFAGTAFIQCPLTLDHGAVQIFLDTVDPDLIPVGGTAIGKAIELSIKAFEKSERSSRALILITDGEDTVGKPVEAAKKANEQGIKVYTIGIGKEGGAPIPNREGGGFNKDRNGNVVMTKLDEQSLQKMALETGGSYVRSVLGDLDLERIYEDIRKHTEDKELQSGRQKRFEERFQWPLFFAFLCFLFEAFLSERKGSPVPMFKQLRWPITRRVIPTVLLFLLILFSGNLMAASGREGEKLYNQKKYNEALKELLDAQVENPSSLAIKYNSANAYYKTNQYPEAEKLYQQVATSSDPKLFQKAYYNLGNTNYRQGKLQEALAFFQKAVELDPKDEDAKHNLEFVRKEIRRRIEENKNRQEQQKNQPKNQGKEEDKKDKGAGNQEQNEKQADDKKKSDGQAKENKEGNSKEKGSQNAMKEMSDDEARQWLSTLKEADRSKYQRKQGHRQYEVEKDW